MLAPSKPHRGQSYQLDSKGEKERKVVMNDGDSSQLPPPVRCWLPSASLAHLTLPAAWLLFTSAWPLLALPFRDTQEGCLPRDRCLRTLRQTHLLLSSSLCYSAQTAVHLAGFTHIASRNSPLSSPYLKFSSNPFTLQPP